MENHRACRSQQIAARPSGKAKACTPCRQQKVKCDISSNDNGFNRCSRCKMSGIRCHFSTTLARTKARSKADLQKEILMLRSQLSNLQPKTAGDEHEDSTSTETAFQSNQQLNSEMEQNSHEPQLNTNSSPVEYVPLTPSREINGVCVEGFQIQDCFTLFFEHYHSMLPIFDPSWDPGSIYRLSPFVFWCIVITGSRRYERDPTLLNRLAPEVKQLSLQVLSHTKSYITSICGLLVLCTWPLPMKAICEDPSAMYAGAAIQLALQHGLQMFRTQNPSPGTISCQPIVHHGYLARIWAYLEFVCHCTSWSIGSPPHYVTDGFDLLPNFDDLSKFLSPSIFWMQEFDKAFTQANIKLTEWAYSDSLSSTKETFRDLIRHFDDEILQMSRKTVGNANPQYSEPVELSHSATPPH